LRAHDGRRVPFASKSIRLRSIETHGQVEWTFRCGKPVGFFVLPWALVLEINVERAVSVVLERHPTAYRKAVKAIGNLETFRVIESD